MCGPAPCDKPSCTWVEKHRRECEARDVLTMPRVKRIEYYAGVKRHRGEAALKDLIEEVKKQWNATQQPSLL